MDALGIGLIAMGVSWPFAGYLGTTLLNYLRSPYHKDVESNAGRIWFGVGVFGGWITLIPSVVVLAVMIVVMILIISIAAVGNLLAPGKRFESVLDMIDW